MRLRLRVGRVHGCPLSKILDEENLQCKGGGRSYELIVLLDSIIPAYLLLAKTRRHSGDRADIRLKIAIGRP